MTSTDKVRADTTVVEADVAHPTDSGLLAKAVGKIARTVKWMRTGEGRRWRDPVADRRRAAGRRARSIASKLRLRGAQQRVQAQATVRRITGELADLAQAADLACATPTRWCGMLAGRCAGPAGRPRAGCIARWTS